jgi:hypothetical protein
VIEWLHLLADIAGNESEEMAEKLKWCRFWNSRGGEGNNISLDLHNEHLNKALKTEVKRLGAPRPGW